MNVTPPIVFWNMVVSAVVVSWCGQRERERESESESERES